VRIYFAICARRARAPHKTPYLGINTGIYAKIWLHLRDLCPIFGYFEALEIEPFVRSRTCALYPKAYSHPPLCKLQCRTCVAKSEMAEEERTSPPPVNQINDEMQ